MASNGEACIALLWDRSAEFVDRAAAAESLMHSHTSACDALWQVLLDESEPHELREEAAGTLGTLWIEMGLDYDRLVQVPEVLLGVLLADFQLTGTDMDPAKLGAHQRRIEAVL